MKDEYKRRREAERHLVKVLPNAHPNVSFRPTRQELIDVDCKQIMDVCSQENEFIVTMTAEWWIETFLIGKKVSRSAVTVNIDSLSEISDDELVPQSRIGKSLWCAMPRVNSGKYGGITFVAPDVVGCIIPDTPGLVCTFYVRTGERLGRVHIPGVHNRLRVSKISDTEFVVGSDNGSLYFFLHDRGRNLKEISRIWKAHMMEIWSMAYHENVIVSGSADWTARLWDLDSRKRLAVLHHNEGVADVAISDDVIVTCSQRSPVQYRTGDIRIYNNGDGYALVKILRHPDCMGIVNILDKKRILCRRFVLSGDNVDEDEGAKRALIMVIDVESECVVAQMQVGCTIINEYTALTNERLVVVGAGGCRGVIVTFPRRFRQLICEKDKKRASGLRMPCSLM